MEKDQKYYTVIIGDISGSRQLSGDRRYQTQLFIKSAIVQINEQYQNEIEAPITITKGDEFQGLLPDLYRAFQIILALERITFPIQLRFGIGLGQVYKMGGKLPIEMDGQAFHQASAALNKAKKGKLFYYISSMNPEMDVLINTIFKLMTAIKTRWNERHYRLYWNYKDLGTYKEVAALENVSPQAICDTLKNIRALEIRQAEKNLLRFLQKISTSEVHNFLPFEETESR